MIFTMKKFLKSIAICVVLAGALCSCSKYALVDDVNSLGERVTALENQVKTANTNISSLQTLVDALNGKIYVTGVTEDSDGYTIKFSDNKTSVIKNGQKGQDGKTPQIGVKKDEDNVYYWTVDGQWLTADGNKVPTSGTTPQLRIEGDKWQASVDNGANWTDVPSNGDYVIIKSVETQESQEKGILKVVLGDGSELNIKYFNDFIYSMVVVPDYDDGSVKVDFNGDCAVRLQVLTEDGDYDACDFCTSYGASDFKVMIAYTQTKGSYNSIIEADTYELYYDDALAILTFDASFLKEDFFKGEIGACAMVTWWDDTTINTGYFPLYPECLEFVQLTDLGPRWAKVNLGSRKPWEVKNYYMWGYSGVLHSDIDFSKNKVSMLDKPSGLVYSRNNYYDKTKGFANENMAWVNNVYSSSKKNVFLKYTGTKDGLAASGTADGKVRLEPADDPATCVNKNWRTPTGDDYDDLLLNTYWEWTENYQNKGMSGFIAYKVKDASDKGLIMMADGACGKLTLNSTHMVSPEPAEKTSSTTYDLSDKHIFFPSNGYISGVKLDQYNIGGRYWCSTYDDENRTSADLMVQSFYFYPASDGSTQFLRGNVFRNGGSAIRPVCD